jgi:hypothetical protein
VVAVSLFCGWVVVLVLVFSRLFCVLLFCVLLPCWFYFIFSGVSALLVLFFGVLDC